MNEELFSEKIVKYFTGISTPEERRTIIKWYNSDPANKKIFDELKEIWSITGTVPKNFEPDVQTAWQSVSAKIDDYEKAKPKTGRNFSFYFSRAAAVLIIGFVLYFVFYWNSSSQITYEKVVTAETKKELVLPDGSEVWLNTNTTLEYVKGFNEETRFVKLSGEAFFEVVKDPGKPFVIETNLSRAKVLGTSFNYEAYPSREKTVLTVSSGKVEFSDINKDSAVVLIEKEKAELDAENSRIIKSLNDDRNYQAWKTGVLVFENETLENIIDDISSHYSKSFKFNNPEIKSTRLTVTFDNKELENVLKILEMTLDVTFSQGKRTDEIIIN